VNNNAIIAMEVFMEMQKLYDQVINGEIDSIDTTVNDALNAGIAPMEIITKYLTPAMKEIGIRFEAGDLFIPEMMVSAQTTQKALTILKPLLADRTTFSKGRVVAGTVKGDLHDIGKWLVCTMLDAAGFEVIDLGVDIPPDKFVEAVKVHKPQIIAMSALLTTTMSNMKLTIEALEKENLRKDLVVLVGGAPVTQEYSNSIGADGTAADAAGAVRKAEELVRNQ
jgi:corrinoid protein of di/trimethylamine methyltransferase